MVIARAVAEKKNVSVHAHDAAMEENVVEEMSQPQPLVEDQLQECIKELESWQSRLSTANVVPNNARYIVRVIAEVNSVQEFLKVGKKLEVSWLEKELKAKKRTSKIIRNYFLNMKNVPGVSAYRGVPEYQNAGHTNQALGPIP